MRAQLFPAASWSVFSNDPTKLQDTSCSASLVGTKRTDDLASGQAPQAVLSPALGGIVIGLVSAALFDLGIYPAAVPAPEGLVWGEVYEMAEPDAVLAVKDEKVLRFPRGRMATNYLLAMEDFFFVYPTKLREYQARYRGSFLHGGVSPEEMILPIAVLTPRKNR